MQSLTDRDLLAKWLRSSEAADRLIVKNPSLAHIASLSPEDIRKQSGISSQNAFNLSLLSEFTRQYTAENLTPPEGEDERALGKFFIRVFTGAKTETVAVLSFLKQHRTHLSFFGGGVGMAVNIAAVKIINAATENNADSIVIAHCHPHGDAAPSPGDIAATRRLMEVLDGAKIVLREHFVIGVNDYYPIIKNLYI